MGKEGKDSHLLGGKVLWNFRNFASLLMTTEQLGVSIEICRFFFLFKMVGKELSIE